MRYVSQDDKLLAELQASVDQKHGLGFRYSHSIRETLQQTKAHSRHRGVKTCAWRRDLHFFDKAGRISTVARGKSVSSITISLKVQT